MRQTNKISATFSQVRQDVQPYLSKQLLRPAYIEAQNVQLVTNMLKAKYSNVSTCPKPINNRAMYFITVKGFVKGGTLSYEIRNNGNRPRVNATRSWVDDFEEYDAIMND